MSNFSGKELNAWRLTKRESRLFPPDSLKFHSFVVEAGSQRQCGRKGSPHTVKVRGRAGRATVPRQLTYCGCHVENVDIASTVRLCLGGEGCIPDCGCRFEESSDATVGTADFVSQKDRQLQHTRRAMKRRANSVPRAGKVLKVSVRQAPVTQRETPADTSEVSRLQPSVIKDSGVAVPNDSPSKPSKQKRGKGKLPADRSALIRKPTVYLHRLPAEVVECYLSRPTVVLSKLCDRLHQCQKVSSSQKSPATARSLPGKRFKPDPKPEELEKRDTRVSGPSTQDQDAGAAVADIREKSAQEDASEIPARDSRLCSKSEPRPEDSERRKKSNSDLKAVDKSKSSSTNSLSAGGSRKSAQKEAPVTSASESRTCSKPEQRLESPGKRKKCGSDLSPEDKLKNGSTDVPSVTDATKSPQKDASATPVRDSRLRSKSEPRPEDSERRKKSSGDLKAVDKSKSSSTNSLSADGSRKSAQKEAGVIPENDSQTHSKSELGRGDSEKKKSSVGGPVTEGRADSPGAELLHKDSNRTSAQKVIRQAKANQNAVSPVINLRSKSRAKIERLLITRKRFRNSGKISSKAAKDVSSKLTNAGTYKAEEQVKRKGSTTIEVIVNGTKEEVKSPVTDPAADNLEEQVSCHPATRHSTPSASALAKSSELKSPIKSGDVFAEGMNYSAVLKVSRLPELTNNNRSTVTTNESVHETCSPALAGLHQKDLQTMPEVKSFKSTRGRQRHDEARSEQHVDRPEDKNEAGLTSGDDNSALKACSPATAGMPQTDLETTPEVKNLKRTRGRPKLDESRSGQSEVKPEDHSEDGCTGRDTIATPEVHPQTASSMSHTNSETKLQQETLERRGENSSSHQKTSNESISPRAKEDDGDKTSALKACSAASPGEPQKDLLTTPEDKSLKRKRGRRRRDETDSGLSLERLKDQNVDRDENLALEQAPVTSPSASGKRFKPDAKPEELERRSTRASDQNTEDQIKGRNSEAVDANINIKNKSAQEESSATSVPESRQRSKSEPRPEDSERRTRSSSDLTTVDKSKSSSMDLVTADVTRKLPKKEAPVTSPKESRTRSKSEPRPEGPEKRKRSSTGVKTEDKVKSPSTDSSQADNRTTAKKVQSQPSGESSKSASKREDSGRRKSRSGDLEAVAAAATSAEDHISPGEDPNSNSVVKIRERRRGSMRYKMMPSYCVACKMEHHYKDAVTDSSRKSSQEAAVTKTTNLGKRFKPDVELAHPNRKKMKGSNSSSLDRGKSRNVESVNAGSSIKTAQEDTPVTSENKSGLRSKSEPRPEDSEKRKKSSSDLKAVDKSKSSSTNSLSADGSRKSAQKESPVTAATEPQTRSKSESRAEDLEKRTRSSSGPRTEVKSKSPAANSATRKSSQKEATVTSSSEPRQGRSKSEPRTEGLEKRTRGSSGPRTEDKAKSPAANSDARKSSQKEAPVASPTGSKRHSKTELRAEGQEKRSRSSSGPRTEDKAKSPVANADTKKSPQKEATVTSPTEPRQGRSKSEPRAEGLEKRTRAEDKAKSPAANADTKKSPQEEATVTSPSEPRQGRSKSEPRAEGLEKRTRSSSGPRTEDKTKSPAANSDARKSSQKEAPVASPTGSKRHSKTESRAEGVEKRSRSSSGPRTEDKSKSPAANADAKMSPQKEATVTSPSEPRQGRSKSEPRAEGLEKRTRSSSGPRTEDKIKSPAANSDARKSSQKEAPVTSPAVTQRRSKSESRAEGVEKRSRSSSGPRTEDKAKSPAANADTKKSPQEEATVTSPSEPRQGRSKSEPRTEGLEKRTRSSSGPRTEDKSKSPAANSDARKSSQKEAPVTPTRESRRRSKSVPRPGSPEKRRSSGVRAEGKLGSPGTNSASANRHSAQKEAAVASGSVSRRRSKSEPRPEALEKRNRRISDMGTQVQSPSRGIVSGDVDNKSAQKETPETLTRESRRRSKSVPVPESPKERKSSSSEMRMAENVSRSNRDSARTPDATVEKVTAAASGSVSRRRSKSEPRPEALEKRNRWISELGKQIESPGRGIVNGDVDSKSAQKMPTQSMKKTSTQYSNGTPETEDWGKEKLKANDCDSETKSANEKLYHKSEAGLTPSDKKTVERQSSCAIRSKSPVHPKLGIAEGTWKKSRETGNDCRTQTTVLNGDEEYNSISLIVANEKTTHQILPKTHIDLSVHTKKIEQRHPVSKLLNKSPSKLERLKAKRHQNSNSNKPRDVFPTSPFHGDSHVRPPHKMFESLAPSPSCRSMRSILSESLTSLNSLSSEGTEIESPAYEPLGSSPVCMQNLRDDLEEIQKTKVISPSCRSDCCTLRQPQGSTSSPPKMQMMSKSAIRRLSDVFDALPPAPECGTANRHTAEEQRQKCLAVTEEDGNATPCHEVDSSFLEEWSKSVREADQVAKAGFVPKYSRKSVDHEATPGRLPIHSDGGKQLISPQKLISASPVNRKPHSIAVNKQFLLGWEPLQSPSNCDPSCGSDDAVVLDINDCESSDSEEDCVITEVRPRSSLSNVSHKTPPLHLREDFGNSTKVMQRTNLGRSLTDIRPEQQMNKSESSTVGVDCASSPRKLQHRNVSQFPGNTSSQCLCHRKDILRRCRSASPRLHHFSNCSIHEEEYDDDDEECVPCDDTTISRLQQINERIQLLEKSTPPVNPLWRHTRGSYAVCLEDGGTRRGEMGGAEEDCGDGDDSDESVIVLDQPGRCFSPRSPSCPPPDLEVKRLSPAQCGSLTVENVAKHNRFLENNHAGPSASLSLSVCGASDSDSGESLHSVARSTLTPRSVSLWESSFAGASTAGLNGVSDCASHATKCRSRSSSKNEDTSNIDLPMSSNPKSQTLTVQRNGAEMLYLLASPSSCASEEVSPVFNRRRNPSHNGGESSATCSGPPRSTSEVREVPIRGHVSQPATPDLLTVGMDDIPFHSPDDIQEVEDFLSPDDGVSSLGEGDLARRNRMTPTGRRIRLFSPPPARLRSPPYSTDEQSSESSMEKRHSMSSMEKSMLLHLYDEMRKASPSEDGLAREEDDRGSAGNDSICVDGSQSSSDSEDLDAERKDTDAEVVAEGFGLQITRGDLATLSGTNWLNDKIVNFYLKLLTERGRQNREPEVYAYDTFFFPKLIKCGFQSVKKWTRVVDVFKHDILIIPVHLGTHWCMTSVDFRKQTIVYYDSMGGQNESCLKTIWDYLHQECVERSVEPLSEEIWQLRCAKDIPMQENNSDCGVFMCKYAECITRDAELEFSQSDMPAIRLDMMEEIRTMNLLHH